MTNDPFIRRIGWLLFITQFVVSAWYTHLLIDSSSASRYSLSKALATRGSLEVGTLIDELVGPELAYDKAIYRGRVYSDKAPLGGLIGSVPVWIGEKLFPVEHWRYFLTSLVIAALPAAACGWMLFYLALRYCDDWRLAAAISIGTAWGTNLLFWSTLMFSHALTTALVLGGFYLLRVRDDPGPRRIAWAGLAVGLAVASDYYVLILLPLFFAWCWSAFGRQAMWLVAGAAVAGLLPAAYHWAIFGSPLTLPYVHHAQTIAAEHHNTGLYGVTGPTLASLWDVVGSRAYGLFVYNPILIVALCALPAFWKRHRRDAALFLAIAILLILFNASMTDSTHGYGWSWGPRYLVPLFPFVMLMLAALAAQPLGKALLRVVAALSALSVALNIYIANIMYLPPSREAFAYLFNDGVGVIRDYGGLSVFATWMKVNGHARPPLSIAATAAVFLCLAAAWRWTLAEEGRGEAGQGESATRSQEPDNPSEADSPEAAPQDLSSPK